jgi:hypothetical protein
MRIVFLLIVFIHGIIHSLGFLKAFEISQLKELTLPISKPLGVVWLITMLLFIVYGILNLTNIRYDWLLGIVAVILSQVIIFMFWKDAKFGTLPNLVILIVSIVSLGSFLINNEFILRVKADFSNNNTFSTDILTEKDISDLPVPVQNYLYYTKSVGQKKIKNFKAEFEGIMRSSEDDKGMNVQSVQYNFYQNPSRYFYMSATKMGMPASGLHIYQNQSATFHVKLLNWINVVEAKGEKMTQGETVTLLNDMCLIAPATLIDDRIEWETLGDTLVKAHFTNGHVKVSAELYFNEKYELVNFISYDRYETDGKNYKNYPWLTPVEEYQMINGYLLPSRGRLIYKRPDGDFIYGELEYKSVKYNLTEIEK